MPKTSNLISAIAIGSRFGRLVVNNDLGGLPRSFMCRCDCGNEKQVTCYQLTSGKTKSCGCLRKDVGRDRMTSHGMRNSREYKAWSEAKQRCSESSPKHKWYGARGIKMADEWVNDFESFYKHIGPCPDGFELDRENNDEGYVPGNVRWVTHSINHANRGNSIYVLFNGEKMTLHQYCDKTGLKYATVWRRMKIGKRKIDFTVVPNNSDSGEDAVND